MRRYVFVWCVDCLWCWILIFDDGVKEEGNVDEEVENGKEILKWEEDWMEIYMMEIGVFWCLWFDRYKE